VEDARVLLEAARRGVLRDTAGSLREAERALLEARTLDPADGRSGALLALTAALRASDHEERGSRGLAEGLSTSGAAGDAAPLVAFLLAPASSRAQASVAAGAAPPLPGSTGEAVAAEALLARGDVAAATSRLEAAARYAASAAAIEARASRLDTELEVTYAAVRAAADQVRLFERELLTEMEEELRSGLMQYQYGKIESYSLLDLYRTYAAAKLERLKALYLYLSGLAGLEAAGEEN
jgi:hypothetical protein